MAAVNQPKALLTSYQQGLEQKGVMIGWKFRGVHLKEVSMWVDQ
jgi:hypothetical protein